MSVKNSKGSYSVAKVGIFPTAAVGSALEPLETEVKPEKRGHTVPDAIMKMIRPMHPSRTKKSCVYTYDSPDHGTGKIVVTISGWLDRERMDEKIQMLEIERVLGRSEPGKVSDTAGRMYSIRLQVRNPYIQVLFGSLAVFVGGMPLYSILFVQSMDMASTIGFFALGAILILLGFFGLVCRGAYRLRWWHRARAEVKRRGDTMPFDLKVLG
ncbi:tetraspanin family protein [Leucobacter aridicollis]|uniref:tetraspanin family protein n=1 Tax=Leucobacter aridicollis TaxID=283878 RepID=UPI002108507D|nr:tetraspanin family protein [Leucobacter aridicollis]UTX52210.1 hypothetical protein KI794_10620 [Leucobacter aridicollis]